MLEMAFPDETLRAWTGGIGPLSWQSETWTGLGAVLEIGQIVEGDDGSVQQLTVGFGPRLASEDLILRLLPLQIRGNPIRIWQGFLADDGSLIADLEPDWAGQIDQRLIDDAGPTCALRFVCVSELEDGDRATRFRITPSRLTALGWPGDKGAEFLAVVTELKAKWPAKGYWEGMRTP